MKQTGLLCGKEVDEKYCMNEYGDCYNRYYETHIP
jgi:hypothetical protein